MTYNEYIEHHYQHHRLQVWAAHIATPVNPPPPMYGFPQQPVMMGTGYYGANMYGGKGDSRRGGGPFRGGR